MKRNANGNGSVRKISVARDGKTYTYWQARYSAGFDPGTGKQKQHSITGKTQKEVLQKLKAATAAIDNGSYIEPSVMTVAQWLQNWSDNYLEGIKPSTAYLYRRSIELYLTPNLGAVKLCALKTQQIQSFYNDLLRPGKKNAEPLSPKTIKNIHGILHKALQQAVANGDIRQNPADACSLPKVVRKEMTVFDDDAAAAFLRAIDGHPHELLYKIALFTGMREGELLGLTWDCIDFANGTISVRQQARQEQKKGGQYYFSTPKNGKGRVLTVPQSVLALFRAQQDKQKEMVAYAGTAWDNVHNLVFTNAAGSFLSHRTVYDCFKRIVKSIGMETMRFHDLRHPYVKHTTKIFSLRLMDFQAQAYPDARRKTRGACQLHRGGQSQSPVRPLCNRKRFSCLPPQSKISRILYAISMRLSGYTSTRSISSSASSVVSVSASKIALDASLRLSCRACSSCFCFACANTAA